MYPTIKKIRNHIAVCGFWLVIWIVIAHIVNQELFVPHPLTVVKTLGQLIGTEIFWRAIGMSLFRIVCGLLIGIIAGIVMAVFTFYVPLSAKLLHPLRHSIRAVPVASFIILALIWIPTDWLPVYIVFLIVLPIVWSAVEKGLAEVDPQLLDMAKVFRLGWSKTLFNVQLPSVYPYFHTACINALGLAWKSGIAAEVICRPSDSIGRMLQEAKLYLETPAVFAWTVVVIALSLALEKCWLVAISNTNRVGERL